MKKAKPKMHLSTESVRNLEARDLARVSGNGLLGQIYVWLTGGCYYHEGETGSGSIRG